MSDRGSGGTSSNRRKVAPIQGMAAPAAPLVAITSTIGLVTTIDTGNTGGLWNKSGSVNFLLFMVIGFCATLGCIAVLVTAYFCVRRIRRQQRVDREQDAELSTTIPEPKELYVVVHPGGTADVAHREDDDQPRKLVLKYKPIELNSAVINMDTIPAYREKDCAACTMGATGQPADSRSAVLTAAAMAMEVQQLEDTARWQHPQRACDADSRAVQWRTEEEEKEQGNSLARPVVGSEGGIPKDALAAASSQLQPPAMGHQGENRPLPPPGSAPARPGMELLLTNRSTASDEFYEDVLLLSQRYSRS